MPRFFVPPEAIHGGVFTLTGSEARHAALVLRKKIGDVIDLFDGKDRSYQGRIDSIATDRVDGSLVAQKNETRSSAVRVVLCQALIKGPKWDWLVEKACEIGVSTLVPLLTARTIVKPARESAAERWKRIALAASKQCGRSDVMEISETKPFPEAVSNLPQEGLALIPWEKETANTIHKAFLSHPSPHAALGPLPSQRGEGVGEGSPPVYLFIGPEGGWDAQEIELAVGHGVVPVTLGPTLLRSETAGLVATALVLAERANDA